jgi:hypothetical protein
MDMADPTASRLPARSAAARAVLLVFLLGVNPAFAVEALQPREDEVLDEVEVRGIRGRIDDLRQEMIRLEDEIYARYNDLNTISKYDVLCSDYARTGTRIERRYCRPVFEDQEKADEGQVALLALQQIRQGGAPPPPPSSVQLPETPVMKIPAQMPAFQKHMRQVMEDDVQLQKLLRDRSEAADRLRQAQRTLFKR